MNASPRDRRFKAHSRIMQCLLTGDLAEDHAVARRAMENPHFRVTYRDLLLLQRALTRVGRMEERVMKIVPRECESEIEQVPLRVQEGMHCVLRRVEQAARSVYPRGSFSLLAAALLILLGELFMLWGDSLGLIHV